VKALALLASSIAFGSFGAESGGEVHVRMRDGDIAVEID